MPSIENHRARYRELHGAERAAAHDLRFLPLRADATTRPGSWRTRHLATYLDSVLEHYEVMGGHFADDEGL